MSRADLLQRLGDVIEESSAEDVDWSDVTEETPLESFGFDSLSVLDLIFDLDQEFGTQLAAATILEMQTVGDLVTCLEGTKTA